MVTLTVDYETTDELGNPVIPDLDAAVASLNRETEFFKALYWMFDGRVLRLTTYNERGLPDAELTKLAFKRARDWKVFPNYMRVFVGSFLRFGPDDCIVDIGILNPAAGGPVCVWCHGVPEGVATGLPERGVA